MVELWQLGLLLATGMVAGFVDAIAGGGGLITLPVLMSLGLPPQQALGTNKLQATFGSASAAWQYARADAVQWSDCRRGFVLAWLGAAAGTLVVRQLDPAFLRRAIPILLIAVALYVLLKPGLGETDSPPRMKRPWFDVVFGLGLGFYDGFLGPGTGTFWAMAFMLGMGFHLTKATAHTKVMNLASNLSSLTLFWLAGNVSLWPGVAMGVGQLIGARTGAALVIHHHRLKRGTRFIRPIFIVVVLAITLKLLWEAL